ASVAGLAPTNLCLSTLPLMHGPLKAQTPMPLWISLNLPLPSSPNFGPPRQPSKACKTASAHARRQALHDLALSMLQYTPNVALYQDNAVVKDVGASLSLFHGPRALLKLLRLSLQNMRIKATTGMAPTALGAWALAGHSHQRLRHCLRLNTLQRRLHNLPAQILPAAQPYAHWLDGLGCHTLAQLRRLPRAGLQQRSSPLLLQQLDAVYGVAAQHFTWFQAPNTFAQRLNLDEKLEHSQALLVHAGRL